jgi:hypothetical protein
LMTLLCCIWSDTRCSGVGVGSWNLTVNRENK